MILEFKLLDNAQDFVEEALRKALLTERNPQTWKYAILHLSQAIELSLKELLRRQHPVLVYRNVDKPLKTVSTMEAIQRLRQIGSLELSRDEIDSLKKWLWTSGTKLFTTSSR